MFSEPGENTKRSEDFRRMSYVVHVGPAQQERPNTLPWTEYHFANYTIKMRFPAAVCAPHQRGKSQELARQHLEGLFCVETVLLLGDLEF